VAIAQRGSDQLSLRDRQTEHGAGCQIIGDIVDVGKADLTDERGLTGRRVNAIEWAPAIRAVDTIEHAIGDFWRIGVIRPRQYDAVVRALLVRRNCDST